MHFWDEHKTITRYYEMKVSGVCEKYQLRQLEYDILMFIYNNPEYNTAADIVRIIWCINIDFVWWRRIPLGSSY